MHRDKDWLGPDWWSEFAGQQKEAVVMSVEWRESSTMPENVHPVNGWPRFHYHGDLISQHPLTIWRSVKGERRMMMREKGAGSGTRTRGAAHYWVLTDLATCWCHVRLLEKRQTPNHPSILRTEDSSKIWTTGKPSRIPRRVPHLDPLEYSQKPVYGQHSNPRISGNFKPIPAILRARDVPQFKNIFGGKREVLYHYNLWSNNDED
ncbi:hypothetical protein EDB92DRAFT_2104785 [Lactarius akahatsu]|uniref:Uncharacterized protein n=1 Tax=Lactarius akahatsu TaxID=416441 RepID=A0AAD4LDT4_9AGAM|nr:hypothetical protein EDB92DRAFT_2104785 [Lactarius akahatsu]